MASNPRLPRLGSPPARAPCSGASGPLSSGTWRPLSHPSRPALADPLTSFPPRAAPWAILRSPCSYRRRRPTARDPAPPRPARPAAGRYHRLCRRRNRRQSELRSHRHSRSGISLVVHCHAVGRGRAGRGSVRDLASSRSTSRGSLAAGAAPVAGDGRGRCRVRRDRLCALCRASASSPARAIRVPRGHFAGPLAGREVKCTCAALGICVLLITSF